MAIAVRRILNAVAESVLACTNPTATTATTAAQPDALNAAVSLPELLRTFLSDDERAILKVLARASSDAHLSASCVRLACQDIEKSKFWPLWANLQVRGLIREVGSGKKRWYVLGAEWLRIILS